MKAKVKSTGVIVDVELAYKEYKELANGIYKTSDNYYFPSEMLDFNLDTPQKQSVTIEGWVARDEDDDAICLFGKEPERLVCGIWHTFATGIILTISSFPDLKWSDEPRKVKITIEEI